MSDDLISRKALLKKLEVFNDRDHGNEHFLLGIESAKEIIKNEPAAFDKKKVIDEFRKEAISTLGITENEFYANEGEYSIYCSITFSDIKEIVEKGGIE